MNTPLKTFKTQKQHLKRGLNVLAFFLLFILMFTFVSAEYRASGTISKNYSIGGRGIFNDDLNDYNTYVTNIGDISQYQSALVYDYDSDNVNEIFVASGNDINIYYKDESTLTYEDTITFSTEVFRYSIYSYNSSVYLLAYVDFGNPNYDGVQIFKYNVSNWYQTGTAYSSNTMDDLGFACYENQNLCLMITERADQINAYSFNLTNNAGFMDSETLRTWASPNNRLCLSSIPDVTAVNRNNDNIYEFYMTEAETSQIGGNVFDVTGHEISVNASGYITADTEVFEREPDFNNGNGCNNYEYFFTAPLMMRVNDDAVDDFVVGISTSDTEFKIYTYEYDGTLIDDFPETFQADGILISNPIKTNIFKPNHNLDYRDFCVMGYTNANLTDLLCASDKTDSFFGLGDSAEFQSNVTNAWTPQASTGQNIIHSSNHKQQLHTDEFSADIDEILTPFGVYEVIYHDSTSKSDKFRKIFDLPYDYGILIDDDIDNVGLKDLIFTTGSSLYVIDDKFTNTNAFIESITVCPSPQSVIKVNTTMTISAVITDTNGDDVQAYASVYNNDANEQNSSYTILVSSGETLALGEFQINKTISNGVIKVFARDSEHNETVSQSLSFSVGTNGAEFGDACLTTTYEPVTDDEDEVSSSGLPNTNTNNAITRFADDISFMSGIPVIIFFLLVIAMIDIILVGTLYRFPHMLFNLIIIIDLFAFIISSMLGIFPVGFTITMYTILLIIGIFYFYSKFFSQGGQNAGGV